MENKKILEINPNECHFIVTYPNGKILKGNALSGEAWKQIPNGLSNLKYILSNGKVIEIPKHKAYVPIIDSDKEGKKAVHYSISVKSLDEEEIIIYKINLRQVSPLGLKIGEVIVGRESIPEKMDGGWKFVG